ncbi:hypothetical protein [Liberiplasma polymorphum]|uniref:hypothetical protein n=1 Tax=Liberiplasma polymorphum TaxID=3374570 RepID=UPI0037766CCD
MNRVKFSAIFNIFIGSSMIMMWAFFILFDMVPEFETAPHEIATHLVAEHLTAVVLIASGVLLLKNHTLAKPIYFVAYGFLMYAVINSMGYFFFPFDWFMTIFFSLILIVSSYLFYQLLKR